MRPEQESTRICRIAATAGRYIVRPWGQRLFLAAVLVLLAILPPTAAHAQEKTLRVELPAPAINVGAQGDLIVVNMGLRGTAFLTVDDQTSPTLRTIRSDIHSLSTFFLPDDQLLLAGRDGSLHRVDAKDPAHPRLLNSWQVEGIPMGIQYRDGTLLVASGAAGVLLFDWDGGGDTPALRGRYPFVDYSKEAYYGPDSRIYLADNNDTGMQVLDVSTPMRPGRIAGVYMGDFVDSVAVLGDRAIIGTRKLGTFVFDVTAPRPKETLQIGPTSLQDPKTQAVEAISDSAFVVAEGKNGTRVYRLDRTQVGDRATVTNTLDGSVTPAQSIAVLPEGRIVVGGLDGSVTLWVLGPADTP
jgi:hypothetical protein